MTALPARGPFTFPAPYHTLGIRITNDADGTILPRTYSYWPNVNTGRRILRVFLGTDRGPQWWEVDTSSHEVSPRGLIFPAGHPLSASTAEGWYWDWMDPDLLYCADDKHLYRYDFGTQELETVVDITPFDWMGRFALRQWHTGGTRHSATVRQVVDEGAWPALGTVVYDEGACQQPWRWVTKLWEHTLDESQVDRAGQWLQIKETPSGQPGEDDRILNLATGEERIITDLEGAPGHSDCGYGYLVGADNQQTLATWRLWPCDSLQSRVILTTPWEAQVIHVSHCNARPGSPETQWVLGSGTMPDLVMIPLDGSMRTRAVAPSMCTGVDYDNLPRASLDPAGEYGCWLATPEGRRDAFLVQIPAHKL
jgi:hypothetical protein